MAAKRSSTYKIGVTGNLCSGKSLVLNILQRSGVNVLDAYETAMRLLEDNPAQLSIRLSEHFGNEALDSRGRLSRKKLTAMLYQNPDKKKFFDDKLGPVIRKEIKKFLYSPMGSLIRAVESPLLFETDTRHLYDEVWVVACDTTLQITRLSERAHLSVAEARLLLDVQWPQDKLEALGDRVIDNSGDMAQIEAQVRKGLDEIKKKAFQTPL